MIQRYLFIAFLGGLGGYALGLANGAQLADAFAVEARYGS